LDLIYSYLGLPPPAGPPLASVDHAAVDEKRRKKLYGKKISSDARCARDIRGLRPIRQVRVKSFRTPRLRRARGGALRALLRPFGPPLLMMGRCESPIGFTWAGTAVCVELVLL
jgi:hypothetical protein